MMYLDANIIAYAAEGHHRYGSVSKKILAAVEQRTLSVGASVLIVLEVLQAFRKMNILLRQDKKKEINIPQAVEALLSLPIVWFDMDLFILERACMTMERLLPADTVHQVTAELYGISEILSADKDFDRVAGLTRIDPLKWK